MYFVVLPNDRALLCAHEKYCNLDPEIILQKKLKAIFTEPLANPDIVNAIASATRVTTLTLDPIETFATEDYFALQYKNLSNLKIALECR
jgi:ABC-type Zn uptake system ZnuABC Zn-binding protein ZnuA